MAVLEVSYETVVVYTAGFMPSRLTPEVSYATRTIFSSVEWSLTEMTTLQERERVNGYILRTLARRSNDALTQQMITFIVIYPARDWESRGRP